MQLEVSIGSSHLFWPVARHGKAGPGWHGPKGAGRHGPKGAGRAGPKETACAARRAPPCIQPSEQEG